MIDSWKNITVGKFLQLSAIGELHNVDKTIERISVLSDLPKETILDMPIDEVTEMAEKVKFLYSEPHPNIVRRKYELNGKTYKLLKNVNEMTTAQYIDFSEFNKDPKNNIIEILSIVLVPEGHIYGKGYDLDKAKEDITNFLLLEDALAIAAFFLTLCKIYLRFSLRSLERKVKKVPKTIPERETALRQLKGLRDLFGSL